MVKEPIHRSKEVVFLNLTLQKLDAFEIEWNAGFSELLPEQGTNLHASFDKTKIGKYAPDQTRAVMEPILVKQFGQAIMDDLFKRFAKKVAESMEKEKWPFVNLVISLTKKEAHVRNDR